MTLNNFLPRALFGLSVFGAGMLGLMVQTSAQDILIPGELIRSSPWVIGEAGQTINIISERVISSTAPEPQTEAAPLAEARIEQLKKLEGDKSKSPDEPVVAKKDESCQCDMLMPGGEIWRQLLKQELENARLQAKLELAEVKFELYVESLEGKATNANKDVSEQLSMERRKMTERAVEMEANMRRKMEVLAVDSKEKMSDQAKQYEAKIEAISRMFKEESLGMAGKLKAVSAQIEKLEKELHKAREDGEKTSEELRKAKSELEKGKLDRRSDA